MQRRGREGGGLGWCGGREILHVCMWFIPTPSAMWANKIYQRVEGCDVYRQAAHSSGILKKPRPSPHVLIVKQLLRRIFLCSCGACWWRRWSGGVTESNVSHDSYSFPHFFKHSICEPPLPMFYSSNETPTERKRLKKKGKRRKKNPPQLLFQLDPIRQAVGRDVLAFASGLIILLSRAICLTEKLL